MKLDEKIEELKKLGFETIDKLFVDKIISKTKEGILTLKYTNEVKDENFIIGKIIGEDVLTIDKWIVENVSMDWFKEASTATSIYDEIFKECISKYFIDGACKEGCINCDRKNLNLRKTKLVNLIKDYAIINNMTLDEIEDCMNEIIEIFYLKAQLKR